MMIRSTSLFWKAVIAMAMARKVLPVPAGPLAKTIRLWRMASIYFFWPMVLGLTGLPLMVWQMVSSSMVSSISGGACSFISRA